MIMFRDMLKDATERMLSAGVKDAETDSWLLAEFGLNITRQKYYMDMQMTVSDKQVQIYNKLIDKRISRVPLQHITGTQQFMGLDFKVNENVLIPRQDTELLVELTMDAINKCKEFKTQDPIKILDMCTGSGCIAISLAKLCENVVVTAADISEAALEVARENAERNEVQIEFVNTNLFENINGKFDVIVSNPPYIPTEVIETLDVEVKEHEPILALDGNDDGLEFYERISEVAFDYLEDYGYLLYETGHNQGESVSSILRKKASCVKVYKDLANNDRVVIAGKDEL